MRSRRGLLALLLAIGSANLALVPSAGSAEAPGRGGSDAVAIAAAHVRSNHARFGVSPADVSDLVVTDAYRSAHTGVTHVYLRQRVNGLEVLGANATVNVTRDGEVFHVGSRLMSGLASAASGRVDRGAARAVRDAAAHLGLGPATGVRVVRTSSGAARETLLSPGAISLSPIPARLVYQPAGGDLRLAWNLEIEEVSQEHWWNASIDAETGALLASYDYVDRDSAEATASAVGRRSQRPAITRRTPDAVEDGASYRVFALPLESPNDGDRTLVTGPADEIASPFGWHDTDGAEGPEFTTTQGNNVHAYIDTTNTATTGVALPLLDADGGDDLVFDFPFDPSLPPTANKDAAVTNLFYWNNIIHDAFYRYGFDEASGNFQVNNYDRGGAGDDSVRAEAQDGSGVNNANFATPTDGNRPRMQMYVWTTGLQSDNEIIDGDFDAGVIIHEYGHGISNRLTGGPTTGGCLSSHDEREGEGWSDWLAIALTALPDEFGEQPRGLGTYVLNEESRRDDGIRPNPYSTDMAINPSTYSSIGGLAEPHGVGYVWATMLWEVFWNLVEEHGFNPDPYGDWTTGGNNLAIQLVMDGMKIQPCEPGFVDARDAILAADVALTEGENQCAIWEGFAKRGLGFSADQGDPSSKVDGTEAFDIPAECEVTTQG